MACEDLRLLLSLTMPGCEAHSIGSLAPVNTLCFANNELQTESPGQVANKTPARSLGFEQGVGKISGQLDLRRQTEVLVKPRFTVLEYKVPSKHPQGLEASPLLNKEFRPWNSVRIVCGLAKDLEMADPDPGLEELHLEELRLALDASVCEKHLASKLLGPPHAWY